MEKQKTKLKQTEIGKIPEDWGVKKLSDVAEIIGGGTPSTKEKDNFGGEIAWLTPRDLSNYNYVHIARGERNITKKGLEGSSAKLLPRGTVLLTSRAPIGYVVIADNEITTNQGFRSLVPDQKETHSEFLYYLLKWKSNLLKSMAFGSTFGELSGTTLKNLEFAFPSLDEQKAITKILSDLDAKIELNREINRALESIGRIFFKKEIINLDKIPKNWKTAKLGDFISLNRGLSYRGDGLADEGIPMVNLGTMAPGNGFLYRGLKHYKGEFKERNLVKPGDVVIANTDITQRRDVLGSPAIVPNNLGSDKILFTHHIYAIRNNSKIPNIFIYYLLQSGEYKNRARGFATGTTVLALPEEAILDLEFNLPDDETLKRITIFLSTIQKTRESNTIELQKLSKIRDLLLPKLMSGEIRVK